MPDKYTGTKRGKVKEYYTMVRHTGYSVNANTEFENAVELRAIKLTDKAVKEAKEKGMVIVQTYKEAREREDKYNWQNVEDGVMIPNAKGEFLTDKSISEEELFLPIRTPF
jgi:hypothetical protein